MGIPFDLKLDSSNDITITDGDLVLTTTNTEMCVQTLGITLNTYQGEWFLDTTFGVPYLQEIVGVARKKDTVDKIFLSYISENAYVDNIDSYSSSYDRDERYYTMTVTLTVAESTVSTTFSTRPSQEYIYPAPSDTVTLTCDTVDAATYANRLYYFENVDGLPENTYATWWNEWTSTSTETTSAITAQDGTFILTQNSQNILARGH